MIHRTGYASTTPESIDVIPPLRWRLLLVVIALTIAGGFGLALALANGAADPPRAQHLLINLSSVEGLETAQSRSLVASLRSYEFPITIEIAADTRNSSDAANR